MHMLYLYCCMLQKSGDTETEQTEGVHLFACKNLLHVRNKTRDDVVYGELGRYPLFAIRCSL